MGWIRRGWNGEMGLAKIFWLYGFVFPFVVGFIYGFAAGFIRGFMHASGNVSEGMETILHSTDILISVLTVVYTIWWVVGTWRSATNGSSSKIWKFLAKAFLILSAIAIPFMIYGMLSGDALVDTEMNPEKFCLSEMRNHALRGGAEPEKYIKDNQAYLQDCINYYSKAQPQKTNP